MKQNYTEILESIGLTKIESMVYLALLELGPANAGSILEKSGVQNSGLHRALNSLQEKGVVSFIHEGRRKIYAAKSPEIFLEMLDNRKNAFEKILPTLRHIADSAEQKNQATIFTGKDGIKKLYEILINSHKNTASIEYNSFGGGSYVTHTALGEGFWNTHHQSRIESGICSRQVFDASIYDFAKHLNTKPCTHIKLLPKSFEQVQETVIIGDMVGIFIFSHSPYAIYIHDSLVAQDYKKQFEVLWERGEEV